MFESGMAYKEIAQVLDRTVGGISYQIRQMNLQRHWSPDEINFILTDNLSNKKIQFWLNRSINSIKSQKKRIKKTTVNEPQ